MSEWVDECFSEWLSEWAFVWVSECLSEWVTDEWCVVRVSKWMIVWVTDFFLTYEWVSQWVAEQVGNDIWIREWVSEWVNEQVADAWLTDLLVAWPLDWPINQARKLIRYGNNTHWPFVLVRCSCSCVWVPGEGFHVQDRLSWLHGSTKSSGCYLRTSETTMFALSFTHIVHSARPLLENEGVTSPFNYMLRLQWEREKNASFASTRKR